MDTEEYPLYYPPSPSSLQYLATTESSLLIIRAKSFTPINILSLTKEESFSLCDEVLGPLSPVIKEIIKKRLRSLGIELEKLFHYFYGESQTAIFFGTGDYRDTFLRCFDSFTYGPDGTMSWERTARKFLGDEKITPVEKYKIACTFCFEEDVRKLWPLACTDPTVNSPHYFTEPLYHYWARRLRNDKREPPTHRYVFKGLNMNCDNWATFKYMLNQNSIEDQLKDIDNMLRKRFSGKIECLLPKLNSVHVDYIFKEYPHQIIYELAWKEKYSEYLFRIWSLIKETITDEKFYQLLNSLSCEAFRCVTNRSRMGLMYRFRGVIRRHDFPPPGSFICECKKLTKGGGILYDLWISAPDNLKREFIQNQAEKFFVEFNNFDRYQFVGCFDHDLRFFAHLLIDMPVPMRESIWRRYWHVIVIRSRPKYLNYFLRLCLPTEAIQGFVEQKMMNYAIIDHFMEFLLENNYYDDLIDYVNLCSSNEPLARKFRKKVLKSSKELLAEPEFDKLIQLSQFIDGTFVNDQKSQNFKVTLFFSDKFQDLLTSKLEDGLANEVKGLTEIYLNSDPNVDSMKRSFLERWVQYISSKERPEDFDFLLWKEFLLWCGGNREILNQFKESLPVDKIFETLVLDAVSKLELCLVPLEETVDAFLKWYFVDETAAKDYKLSKVIDFQRMEGLKNTLQMDNECVVDNVLRWFFDDDQDRIANFKRDVLKRGVDGE